MDTATAQDKRIYGPEIFFNFLEIEYADIDKFVSLAGKIKTREVDGYVVRNVFTQDEIEAVKKALDTVPADDFLYTPASKLLPAPFAIMSDSGEKLDTYYNKLALLYKFRDANPIIKSLLDKLDVFFKKGSPDYKVSVPINKIKHAPVAPGNFRFFTPGLGAVHVHCGNWFQQNSLHYYSLIENDIDMDDQLSYFLMIQQPEQGGQLTIYDLLWDTVKRKETPENNDFVIDDNDKKIFIKDTRQFMVDPGPGDIVIFAGGPIWHRVEGIVGSRPRITLGGFLNFSHDNTELYYWS